MLRFLIPATLFLLSQATSALSLQAPSSATIDSEVAVTIDGAVDSRSFVSIVPPDSADGFYADYVYTRASTVKVPAPPDVGSYEVRLMGAEAPYPTLARRPITIGLPTATIDAPALVPIGTTFDIQWRGPSAAREYITLVAADLEDGKYEHYAYTKGTGSGSVQLTTPSQPGAYELRYMTGKANRVIARRTLTVGDVDASISFAPTAGIGSELTVEWSGPGNPRDFITIVRPDAGEKEYDHYVYAKQSPLTLTVPETAGTWEVRFLTADNSRVLARGQLVVGAAQASVDAVATVEAGAEFEVSWSGPDNELDYIAVTVAGNPEKYLEYSYTRRGNPLQIRAPREPGTYELHYLTGRSRQSLASRSLQVVPGNEPGTLRVIAIGEGANAAAPAAAAATGGAGGDTSIELILDASGSMLQKMGGQRRIDIARNALDQLVQNGISPGTPLALRVFGHTRPDACDTELVSTLAPLQPAAIAATIRQIEAKNLAKTPIAASLAAVAEDLAGIEGRALVILVTDGEETCGGDPAAAIATLRAQGFEVVLNIIGFAIDEYALETEFRRWAELGGGAYFPAADAAALGRSVQQAIRMPFGIHADGRRVASGVIGGDPVVLKPGHYELHAGDRIEPFDITAGEETTLSY